MTDTDSPFDSAEPADTQLPGDDILSRNLDISERVMKELNVDNTWLLASAGSSSGGTSSTGSSSSCAKGSL